MRCRSALIVQMGSDGEVGASQVEFKAGEIDEWALKISEGQRIRVRLRGGSRQ
jgi:hypothetical protein